MVALYVDGNRVGTLEAAAPLLDLMGKSKTVELRDEADGRKLGTVTPEPICPWQPGLTEEELDRRCQQKGKPLSEILKRLGAE